MIYLFASLVVLAIGAAFIWRGLVGVRIDDHPICAKCGFDALGTESAAWKCPECGTELDKPGRIRAGNRRRRPVFIGVGMVLLVPGLLVLSAWAAGKTGAIDWTQYKPVWMLRQELVDMDGPTAQAAAEELERRSIAGSLDAAAIASVLRIVLPVVVDSSCSPSSQKLAVALMDDPALLPSDRASTLAWILQRQGDRTKPWSAVLGECYETAFLRGQVSGANFERYMNQATDPRLVLLSTQPAAQRDSIPVYFLGGWRWGSLPIQASVHVDGLQYHGKPLDAALVNTVSGMLVDHPIGSIVTAAAAGPQAVSGSVCITFDSSTLKYNVGESPIVAKATVPFSAMPTITVSKPLHASLEVGEKDADALTPSEVACSIVAKSSFVAELTGDAANGGRLSGVLLVTNIEHTLSFDFDLSVSHAGVRESLGQGSVYVGNRQSKYSFRSNGGSSGGGSGSGSSRCVLNFQGPSSWAGASAVDFLIRVRSVELDGKSIDLASPVDIVLRNIPVTPPRTTP